MRHPSLIITIVYLALSAWVVAGEIPLATSSIVPGATAKVKYEHDRNRNIKVAISTEHLPAPQQLSPAKNNYVVWIIPRDGQPQNAGVLTVNNDLKGSFSTTTPAEEGEKQIWRLPARTAFRSELVATRLERNGKNFSDTALSLTVKSNLLTSPRMVAFRYSVEVPAGNATRLSMFTPER